MILLEARWSLGVLIGVPSAILALFLGIVWTIFAFTNRDTDTMTLDGLTFFGRFFGPIIVIVTLVASVWGFFPYEAEYHQWTETSGEVADVNVRLVSSGESMQEKYVVRYTDGRERGCLDTRCANVNVGDILTMECKRVYQWSGTDGYDCNFVSRTPARE